MNKPVQVKVKWITEKDAASLLGCTPQTLRKRCKSGNLAIGYTCSNKRHYEYNFYDIHQQKLKNSTYQFGLGIVDGELTQLKPIYDFEQTETDLKDAIKRIEENQLKIIVILEQIIRDNKSVPEVEQKTTAVS